jgi:hypothetical protein
MNGYTVAVWSTLILAELLLISAGLNIFCLRRRWWTQVASPPHAAPSRPGRCRQSTGDQG